MRRRWLLLILFCGMALAMLFSHASAQNQPYKFSVDKETVNVYWNSDGTVSVDYVWVFTNDPGGHVIDFVDVGMPNSKFDIATIKADTDGAPVAASQSDYQGGGSGFAVAMGSHAIYAGHSGTVHVYIGKITDMLYVDANDQTYTSAVFAPTWFGSQYVKGTTDLTMTFHLPPNMKPSEPRWHQAPGGFPSTPQTGYDADKRATYAWHSPKARATERYWFGASFPRSYVPADSIYVPPPEPLIDLNAIPIPLLCGGILVIGFLGMIFSNAIHDNRRKMQYLPPKISIEGHGIKRGLTAVESAILMEQPLDKVLTMILFGAIRKNAAKVTRREPLTVEVKAGKFAPEDLHGYERLFLEAFKQKDEKARQNKLASMMVGVVNNVSGKMRGFSRKETVDYYKSIVEQAWQQVESANTPEVKSLKFDAEMEWTMLDKNYDDRTRRVFHDPIYVPSWWGDFDPAYRPTSSSLSSGSGSGGVFSPTDTPASGGGSVSHGLPGSDFAAQMVLGVQAFSQNVVGNISTFTEKIAGTTNPPPKPDSSDYSSRHSDGGGSSGGGGESSCACACACAGCACACAGDGR